MARAQLTLADRLGVASRIVAAVAGGYAFANVIGIFLVRALPSAKAETALAMTLASFAVYAAAIIWTFAARSARIAWLGLLVPTLVLGALVWLLGTAP